MRYQYGDIWQLPPVAQLEPTWWRSGRAAGSNADVPGSSLSGGSLLCHVWCLYDTLSQRLQDKQLID